MQGKKDRKWPKEPVKWIIDRVLYVSIVFTFDLQEVYNELQQTSFFWDTAIVGGPAVYLMPGFFRKLPWVTEKDHYPGVLQRINPLATRSSIGCVRNCKFCAVKKTEGAFRELDDWLDLPILCDNNLIACSKAHFEKVICRLQKHNFVDFNQGIDARLLTRYHAELLATLKKPKIRLALDNMNYVKKWDNAINLLLDSGVAKSRISSYVLIGFDSDPYECWQRCEYVRKRGVYALPQWFHELDALKKNKVTVKQRKLGWTRTDMRKIMEYFYAGKWRNDISLIKYREPSQCK